MTDTTTGQQPTPPATPPAPVPQPPAMQPAAPADQPTAPATGQQPPAVQTPNGKTFTQDDVNRIINERLTRERESLTKSFGEKLAEAFGGPKPEGDGKTSGDDVLKQAQQIIEQANTRANTATARSFAQAAKIKADRLDPLLAMVDLKSALSGVNTNDTAAVDAAIKAAIDAKAAEFPEWRVDATPPLPGSSTANPNQQTGDGKRVYTRSELESMSQRELAAIADDLIAAQREGRIK